MAISIKTEQDVQGLRRAAGVVNDVLTEMARRVGPGVETADLDRVAEEIIRDAGGRPAFKGYQVGSEVFPASLCISTNETVVHGFPGDYRLQEGDLVSVDCGVELEGYFGDYAYTFAVGEVSEENQALLNTTKQSLYEGISQAIVGKRVGDIGYAVQRYCEARGYGVVRDLVGHGIGTKLHEEPQVPNTGRRGQGKRLKDGMALCIEPMINRGTERVTVDADGWTIRTADGQPSAHYEHTVIVRRREAQVLSSYTAIEGVLRERGIFIASPSEVPASAPDRAAVNGAFHSSMNSLTEAPHG